MENKPLVLAIEESEQTLVGAVNAILQSGIPPYFVKMVFDKVYADVKNMAEVDLNNAKIVWSQKMAETAPNSDEQTEQ